MNFMVSVMVYSVPGVWRVCTGRNNIAILYDIFQEICYNRMQFL